MGAGASNDKAQTVAMTPSRPTKNSGADSSPMSAARPPPPPPPTPNATQRSGHGQWQYASDVASDDWTPIPSEQNDRIEDSFKSQHRPPNVQVALGRFLFTLDFESMSMQQGSSHAPPKPVRRVMDELLVAPTGVADTAQHSDDCVRVSASAQARGLYVRLAASVKAHEGLVYCARFDASGKTVVTGSRDGTLRMWEVDTGFVTMNFEPVDAVVLNCSMALTKPLVASGCDDGFVRLYTTTSSVPRLFDGHTHKVYGVDFTSDSRHIVSGAMDAQTRLWDVATGQCVHTFEAHTASVFTVAASHYSPNLALTGGDDNVVISYDLRARSPTNVFRGHTHTLWACDVRFDEQQFCSSGMDGRVLLWDPRNPTAPIVCAGQHYTGEKHPVPVHSVEYSPDGTKIISAARDNTWRLWDAEAALATNSSHELCSVNAHDGVVFCATYNAPRSQIISIGSDSTVRIWDTGLC